MQTQSATTETITAKVHPQATDPTGRQGQSCLVVKYHEAHGMHEVFFADGETGFYPEDSLVWE